MNNSEMEMYVNRIIEIEEKAIRKKLELDAGNNKTTNEKIDSDVVDHIVELIEKGAY